VPGVLDHCYVISNTKYSGCSINSGENNGQIPKLILNDLKLLIYGFKQFQLLVLTPIAKGGYFINALQNVIFQFNSGCNLLEVPVSSIEQNVVSPTFRPGLL
jgi:hypothetical protein